MNDINLGKARLGLMLKQLEVEGALRKVGSKWQRSGREWTYDEERIRAVTAARRAEQQAMEAYGSDGRCLMELLRSELDDPGAEPCGRCAVCAGPRFDGELDRELSLRAIAMVRDRAIEIEPRKSTPAETGGFPRIPRGELLEPGRALSSWNDAGWGRLVARGKFEDERFDDDLVTAAAALVENWKPDPAPTWVTAVPSLRRPELVPEFAERLAAALGLPYARRGHPDQGDPRAEPDGQLPPAVRQRPAGLRGRSRGLRARPGALDRRHRGLALDPDRGRSRAAPLRGRRGLAAGPGEHRGRRLTADAGSRPHGAR